MTCHMRSGVEFSTCEIMSVLKDVQICHTWILYFIRDARPVRDEQNWWLNLLTTLYSLTHITTPQNRNYC
jgi:hypothetical protein